MQTHLEKVRTESAAHRLRTEELARRLGTRLSMPSQRLRDSCRDFDAAAECAALEGRSIGESLRQCVAEGSGAEYPELGTRSRGGTWLPVIAPAISRLLRTTGESVSTRVLEDIAGAEPALAERLLSAANSARFGSRCRFTGVREAILRLGVVEAQRVLVSGSMASHFAAKEPRDLWKHSQAVAEAACEIALQVGLDTESAWVAGLLHDVGRWVLAASPAARRVVEQNWLAAGFPLAYSEALAYGQDHAEAAVDLLKQWELPAEIVEAVALHHRPECSDSRLTAVLCLAEDLVAARFGTPEEDLWPGMRRRIACERAGMSVEDFEALKRGCLRDRECA